jgi:Uma2 family endonuclease
MATVAEKLLTGEEYRCLPDNGQLTELVRGRVVPVNMPTPRQGEICGQTYYLLRRYLEEHPIGRVVTNDSAVVTKRDPDTVRGADVVFYSFAGIPQGPLPDKYLPVPPELVFEVHSTGDRWPKIHAKVAEYLEAGVKVVCVLDQQTETAHVFPADDAPYKVSADQELMLPQVLDDFRVLVRRFFE